VCFPVSASSAKCKVFSILLLAFVVWSCLVLFGGVSGKRMEHPNDENIPYEAGQPEVFIGSPCNHWLDAEKREL
jgi:hypothetical protein